MDNDSPTDDRQCCLCEQTVDDIIELGEKLSTKDENGEEIVCHYFCLLFSCNLVPRGKDDEGIKGYLVKDIIKERNRGRQLKCHFCNRRGPTAACCNTKCKIAYHVPCAVNQKPKEKPWFQFLDKSEFKSFCSNIEHRPVKAFPPVVKMIGSSVVVQKEINCSICSGQVKLTDVITAPYDIIQCPHCTGRCHRICVAKYAKTAGEKHFRCLRCNCSVVQEGLTEEKKSEAKRCHKRYVKYCRLYGVYVPKKDADWELDHVFYNFADQYQDNYDECDAETCLCPEGREHDTDDVSDTAYDWYICLCAACATSGIHRKCGNISPDKVKSWYCEKNGCKKILTGSRLENPSPPSSSVSVVTEDSSGEDNHPVSTTSSCQEKNNNDNKRKKKLTESGDDEVTSSVKRR